MKTLSFYLPAIILSLSLLSACQTTNIQDLETAEGAYKYASQLSEKERNEEAIAYLNQVKNKHPYSDYAIKAKLKIADIHFKREHWVEAESSYKLFKEFHPKNPRSDYVTHQIAMSIYNQLPSSTDRDLSLASRAILYFNEVIASYPQSDWRKSASEHKNKTRKMLANKELYIADFYFIRNIYSSALLRYEKILRKFPNIGANAKALYGASVSAFKTKDMPKAKQYLSRLAKLFPNSSEYAKAKNELQGNQ